MVRSVSGLAKNLCGANGLRKTNAATVLFLCASARLSTLPSNSTEREARLRMARNLQRVPVKSKHSIRSCPRKCMGAKIRLSLPGLTRQSILFATILLAKKMDARVKPAHDDLRKPLILAPMGSSPGVTETGGRTLTQHHRNPLRWRRLDVGIIVSGFEYQSLRLGALASCRN